MFAPYLVTTSQPLIKVWSSVGVVQVRGDLCFTPPPSPYITGSVTPVGCPPPANGCLGLQSNWNLCPNILFASIGPLPLLNQTLKPPSPSSPWKRATPVSSCSSSTVQEVSFVTNSRPKPNTTPAADDALVPSSRHVSSKPKCSCWSHLQISATIIPWGEHVHPDLFSPI